MAAAAAAERCDAARVHRLRHQLEEQPLVRVHSGRLGGGEAKEGGLEVLGPLSRAEEAAVALPVGGRGADRVDAAAQLLPKLRGVVAASGRAAARPPQRDAP